MLKTKLETIQYVLHMTSLDIEGTVPLWNEEEVTEFKTIIINLLIKEELK